MIKIYRKAIELLAVRVRSAFQWHRFGNKPNSLVGAFVRTFRLVEGKMSRSVVLGILFAARQFAVLFRNMGPRGLALYLKASAIAVMRAGAGSPLRKGTSSLGIRVSLSRSGIPRWVPPLWRAAIRAGDPIVIKRVLTLCNLYRVIEFKGKFKLSTITKPGTGRITNAMYQFIPVFWGMLGSPKLPNLKWKPLLITRAGPGKVCRNTNTSLGNILSNLWSLHLSPLWKTYCDLAVLLYTAGHLTTLREILTIMASEAGFDVYKQVMPLGKLAVKEEPGKKRVFAMVDYWTQCLLYPLHRWVFDHILKKIWNDATFDQGEGVRKVQDAISKGFTKVYSFDLSAATDRLPIAIQSALLDWVKPGLGILWETLLVGRDYVLPYSKGKHSVRYAVGQPMGAYSSWALLALTHHFIVQFAAWKAGYKGWFDRYMVLGDDIVIWDQRVSSYYTGVMLQLGVEISPTKSILSHTGGAEFAKRYLCKGIDASPISLAEVQVASGSLEAVKELAKRHGSKLKPGDVAAFQGRGYKSRGRLNLPFRNMSRSLAYMCLWLLVPGTSISSVANWSDWFMASSLTTTRWIDIVDQLGRLAAYIQEKIPVVRPRFGPFSYFDAILGVSSEVSEEDMVHRGEEGSVELLELELGALFGELFQDLWLKDQKAVRQAGIQFKRREYPLDSSGVDRVMSDLGVFHPDLSQFLVPEGEWGTPGGLWTRRSLDPKEHLSAAAWFRLWARVKGIPSPIASARRPYAPPREAGIAWDAPKFEYRGPDGKRMFEHWYKDPVQGN